MVSDPIIFAGGANLYGYIINDPINLIDPKGAALIGAGACVGIAAISFASPMFRILLGR